MKTALFYLMQVIACSGILYGYYYFFLRNKKFHQYNRYFLLLAVTISVVIPFLQIPVYFENEKSKPLLLQTLTVLSSGDLGEDVMINSAAQSPSWLTWKNILSLMYISAGLVLFTRFWLSLINVIRMMRIYPGEKVDSIRFIQTDEPSTPFSFFRWLFWNNKIDLNSDCGQQILRHELFHIRQKHSWDVIFLEITAIVLWVNPFFHLIKKEIKAIHEFLADKHAVEDNREWDYAELLLMQALGTAKTRLINPFFHNQIKRRIAMLTTSNKPGYQYLRKIMVLPLAAIIIGLFAFTYKNRHNNPAAWQGDPFTIIIDAAHGGNDPGATSPGGEINEAELTLQLAKSIEALAGEYNVNVVMTRKNAAFPGNTTNKDAAMRKRIELSNETDPVAFVSLHINTSGNVNQNHLSGFEAYIAQKRDGASTQLASFVLGKLSSVYKTRGETKIRETSGVYVLDKNSSPAILLQCGYIDNTHDVAFITQKKNQEKVARSILEAMVNFKSYSKQEAMQAVATDTVPEKFTKKSAFISHPQKIILQADTIFFHPESMTAKPDFNNSLVVVNDAIYEPGILRSKTIISKEVHLYSKGDEAAVRLFGNAAANGALVFKDAKIIDEAPADFYKYEFSTQKNDTDKIFSKVEIEPAFQGGRSAWEKYLKTNMDNTIPIKKDAPPAHYTVFIQFIVDQDGNVGDITPLTKHGYGMEEEAMRLIKNGPKWLPGIQNGHKVKAYKKQRFDFIVGTPEKNSRAIVSDTVVPIKEVVVQGYPMKKYSKVTPVLVEGRPIKKSYSVDGKKTVVVSTPTHKIESTGTLKEVEVVGKPSESKKVNNSHRREIEATPIEKVDGSKLKEVEVVGKPLKKSGAKETRLEPVVVQGRPIQRKDNDKKVKEVVVEGKKID